LDSSAVGTAQPVVHEAGECILCHEGGNALFSDDFWEELLILSQYVQNKELTKILQALSYT